MTKLRPNRAFSFSTAVLLSSLAVPAMAGSQVTFSRQTPGEASAPTKDPDDNSDAWHRKLWTGSFDKASDASSAAAKQLDGLQFDCNSLLQPHDGKPGDMGLYATCMQRKQAGSNYAAQARSIAKQQNVMSIVSKASDVAAVGAVAGVAYAEIGVKQTNQAGTYASAANIQRMAGTAAYTTGAADLAMGAYAYAAQKQKLEQMKNTISGAAGGVKVAPDDPAVTGALTNAVEAAKKAAYAHMMWGAGKLAAGYGMMYLAKKSDDQAARMGEIQADKDLIAALNAQQATQGTSAAANAAVAAGGGPAPYYQNNSPTFTIPNGSGTSSVAPAVVSYGTNGTGSTTGGSAPMSALSASGRSPSSAGGGLSGGGGGAASATGDSKADAAPEPGKEKNAKEAIGSSFEMQLTGGMRGYSGNAGSSGGKDEVPNIAALMGAGDAAAGGKVAATGLSPTAIYDTATEGTEGREQGSMSGVNAKSETSLFAITKAKLTKMFQVGNVGIPKNVEVKN